MLAVISWQCDCGTHVKVMYETQGVSTIRCPNSFCNFTRIITGRGTTERRPTPSTFRLGAGRRS